MLDFDEMSTVAHFHNIIVCSLFDLNKMNRIH